MDSGRCRRCGRPYTAGEVTGLGILRPRAASRGGPIVEFTCPACRTVHRLVPHGSGRYAPPGEPPPPEPPTEEREVPWSRARPAAPPRAREERAEEPPPTTPGATAPPKATAGDPPPGPEGAREEPLGVPEAARLLGLEGNAPAEEVERAYRERALTCHPDKVAHLDADFVALAEQKFRRLAQAREVLLMCAARRAISRPSDASGEAK